MSDPNPPTQTELLEEQRRLMDELQKHINALSAFNNNAADEPVTTESGNIPSLRGLIEQIRQMAGFRTYEITWSGEALLRYASEAEPLLRCIHTRNLLVAPGLAGSYFKLATTSAQPIVLEVKWGDVAPFTVTFAANSDTGVVTGGPDVTDPIPMPAGTMVTVKMKSSAWTAAGLALAMTALIDVPAADVAG